MTLQTSGAISLNDIHVEAGGSSGTQVSLNDQDIRDIALVNSNESNSFNSYYGGKRAFVMSIGVGFGNITNPETQYNPATVTRTRGYSDGEFSNRTPSTFGTIGGVNSQSNSAASYSGFSGASPNQDVQWIWTHTYSPAQSFTNNSVAIPPFTAVGTTSRGAVSYTHLTLPTNTPV